MTLKNVVLSINERINSYSEIEGKLQFFNGNLPIILAEVCKEKVPFQKVAVLYSKSSYEKYGIEISKNLKAKGNSVTHLVLPDNFCNSIESFSHLFNLAEDIRMVVSTDYKLNVACKYFAFVRKVNGCIFADNLLQYRLLDPTLDIQNAGVYERVKVDIPLSIILSDDMSTQTQSLSEVYAFIVSHALALTDYRVNKALNGKHVSKEGFLLATKSITNVYPLFNHDKIDQPLALRQGLLGLELANLLCDGEIYHSFSCNVASKLMNSTLENVGKNTLLLATSIAKIYELYISGLYGDILEYPNYLQRAQHLSFSLKLSQKECLENLTTQAKIIRQNQREIKGLNEKLHVDLQSFKECSIKMLNIYKALGGDADIDLKKRADAIRYSGDFILNGMSIVRESGIAEYI